MAYIKNTWVDQDVERPKTYEVTNNQDGSITLTDSFGLVTELGTPVNATNMNHIEEGIENSATIDLDNLSATGEAKFENRANVDLSNLSMDGESRLNSYFRGVVNDGNIDTNGNLDLIDAEVSTDTIYEYSQPGTYTFSVPTSGTYNIVIVGGGGAGAQSASSVIANTFNKASGGSGAAFAGTIALSAGTYTAKIGGMNGRTREASVLYNGNNEALITANGGGSATATVYNATAGAGGTLVIADGVTVGTNSASHNGNGYAGTYANNSTANILAGGASIYNGYGYGGSSNWGWGGAGYFKITIQNQGSTTVNYKVTPNNPLTIVDNSGVKTVLTGVNNDIVGSLTNGTYNKFVDGEGTELLKNTIYRQLKAPTTPNANDVWIKTVDRPEIYKYNDLEWEEYNKVYIGSFTITSGAVSNIKNTELYNNGFNVTKYNPQITETYKNGTEWYRIYSDGWCEQGGAVTPSGSGEKTVSITLLKSYLDTNYFVVGNYCANSTNQYGQCYNITVSGFTTKGYGGVTNKWMTCGYIN